MPDSSRYLALEVLHHGADTVLCRARRRDDGRSVVLKILRRDPASPHALGRLHHEHEIARALDTPVVVKVHALASFNDQTALILEDFGGRSLDQLPGRPMPLERFFPLALRLAGALAELHRHHVIHKDIKPQNLLYNPDTEELKITDLGIACLSPRELEDVAPSELIEGTLAYMAPEQTGRMNRSIDERADLYSLGVTLYELLTGTLPFEASDPVEWVYCHIALQPRPPHAVVPSIPAQLSAVVLKLLAKAPEERYQSALGLRHDLEQCSAQLRATGAIEPFPLGQRDVSDRFQVPRRLYGREREIESLLAVFDRVVAQGRPELVLVSGYSGVGKSSLVAELHRPVARERGCFLSGKFDQLMRDVPYLPFLQAFRGLLQEILCVAEDALERWRQRLQEALGPDGRLLADVLPEIELLLGPQPPVPELPAAEARRRFHAALQRFVAGCARKEHPMVLFLDDLQWADAGSLQLLEQLVTYSEPEHLLLIGAYRDNEVGPAHPLTLTLAEARKSGAAISDIVLEPLSAHHVEALVAEAVHAPAERARPLARLVYEKTGGNPFFALQLLLTLHREGLIALDAEERAWRWDTAAIREKGFSDNVADLMAGNLRRLSSRAQDALKLAACLGGSLPLTTLATVANRPAAELREALAEAVEEGLIVGRDGAYRFLHDRVQQAAYALIPAAQRAEVHLRIGRLLLKGQRAEEHDEMLFDIVGHLNRGAALLRSPAERDELAALNLRAGKKAKASAAYESAAALFAAGTALLAEDRWETQYELAYELSLERARCAYATSNFDEAERLLDELMDRARTGMERAAVVERAVALNLTRGRPARAVELGLSFLRGWELDLSPHVTDEQVEQEMEGVWQALGDRAIEDLIDLPPVASPEIKLAMDVLAGVAISAYFMNQNLHHLLIARMVKLCLRHGNAESSAHAYTSFGRVIGPRFGRYEEAYRFGKLGYDLADRGHVLAIKSLVFPLLGQYVFWTRHYREACVYFRLGFNAAIECGDLNNACFAGIWAPLFPLLCGEPLEDVLRQSEGHLAFVRKSGYEFMQFTQLGVRHLVQTLRGRPASFSMMDGSELDQAAFESRLPGAFGVQSFYYSLKAQGLFLLGSPEEACAATARAVGDRRWKVDAHVLIPESFYYRALALAAVRDEAPSPRDEGPGGLLDCERQLAAWAESCPENYAHKHALVRAEIARLRGHDLEAIRLYEQAISSAREHGFVQHEAIAYELSAGFYRARGLSTPEAAALREARACYCRWGAHAKVDQLDQRFPFLAPRTPIAPTVTFAVRAEQFDVLSVVKASQSISGELKLPRLLEMLLRIVVEHAGADEGYVLLSRGDRLSSGAAIAASGGAARLLDARDAAAATPRSVLNYVRRSHERVLLDDATARHPFSEDEHFTRRRPRSVLCLPIVRQARLLGVLYLENKLVTGAFTPGRLSVLELLVSQSAISLENAMLYAELEQENAERRRAEQALKTNQETLRAIVDNSPAAIYVKDREGRHLLINRHAAKRLRLPVEEILGKTAADLFAAPIAEVIAGHDRAVFEAGAPMEWEEELPLEDGPHTYLSVKFPLGEGPTPHALGGVSTDITARKRAERAERFLAEASRKLMALGYDATSERVAQLAVPELADQCVVEVRFDHDAPGHTAAAGVPADRMESVTDALRPLTAASPVLYEAGDARAAPDLERLGVHAVVAVPLLARGRCFGVMTLLSTAPRRRFGPAELRLAEELGRRAALALDNARLFAEAQEAIRRRDEFLVVASHELKTPLTSLQMQAQLVERMLRRNQRAALTPERIEATLRILTRQLTRLGHLVDELLDVTRVNAGQLTIARAPVDLAGLSREVVERMSPQLADARCQPELDLDEPVVGRWDPSRLEQILINLLSNAMKYGAGGPVHVSVRRQADHARLVVRDHGIGIAKADQARIFERFERAASVRSFGGLGLGLYIVRQIVASHGGTIGLESEPGAGATFVVELPLDAAPAEAETDGPHAQPPLA